jgi:hypothetical protein
MDMHIAVVHVIDVVGMDHGLVATPDLAAGERHRNFWPLGSH